MLVEEYLVAVPAGGLTRQDLILILDRSLAKRTNHVGFFKVENDGFDLGAQRRPIALNDLPRAREEITDYLRHLCSGEPLDDFHPTLGLIVEKEKIAANGEYNLSGERYRENTREPTPYTWAKIGNLIKTVSAPVKIQKTAFAEVGRFPIIDQSQKEIAGWTNDESAVIQPIKPFVIFGDHTCTVKLIESSFAQGADGIKILSTVETLDPRFLYYILRVKPLENKGYQRHFSSLKDYEIPLPPLQVQQEIVAEIEGYQKVIDGARTVVDHYRPQIPIDPNWPMTKIGEACELVMDGTHSSPKNTKTGAQLYITSKNVRENFLDLSNVSYISEEDHASIYERCPVQKGDVLYVKDGSNTGLAAINTLDQEFSLLSSVAVLRGKSDCLDNRFLSFFLNTNEGRTRMLSMVSGVAITRLTLTKINQAEIPLPAIQVQKQIIAEIESEEALVANCQKLVNRFQEKIRKAIGRVWGSSTVGLHYETLHNTQADKS